jgi:DNA-binding NarL/FixJ family response regulator
MSEILPRKRKLTQIQVAVLQGLDAGKTNKEIEIEYGINPSSIRSSIVALEKYGYYYGDREKERKKSLGTLQKRVLDEIKKSPKTRREIAEILGINYAVVSKIVRDLISKELITRDEVIESARTGQKTKKLTDKQQTVLEAVKEGKTKKKIKEQYTISASTYDTIIKALVGRGLLSKEEAVIANLTERQVKVLQGVRDGKTRSQMVEEYDICYESVNSAQKALIEKGIISQDQIVLTKDSTRITEFQERVLSDLKSGKTRREIADYYGVSYQKISSEIYNLVTRGLITREEIAKTIRPKRKELSTQQNVVLNNLKAGKTRSEIAQECGIEHKIVYSISKTLINRGDISEDEIKNSKRGRKATTVKLTELERDILEGLRSGKTKRELEKQYNVNWNVMNNMIRAFIRRGLILREDIKEEKVEDKMRKETDLSQKNDLKELVYKDIKAGMALPEIAKKYNNNKIGSLVLKLIAEGRISGSEVKTEVPNKRKERDNGNESGRNARADQKKKKPVINEQTKKKTEADIPQPKAEKAVPNEKADDNQKSKSTFPEAIDQLRECMRNGEIPDMELLAKAKKETMTSLGYLDKNSVGLILRGYSARKEHTFALGYINECRNFQRARGRENPALEESFKKIENAISTGSKEMRAIKNMRWGASIHDSANDAGISEKRATELYNKYVKPTKEIGGQEEIPQYEIEF